MQKEKAVIHTVKLDFGLPSLSPWTKIKNVCMAHSNVQGLTVKFFSGFQVSCNSKVERTVPNWFFAIWSVWFQCSTSMYSSHLGATKGQWGDIMWEFVPFHTQDATFSTWWEMVPEVPLKVCGAGQEMWVWVWEIVPHLIWGPLKTEKKNDKNLYWSPATIEVPSPLLIPCLFYKSKKWLSALWGGEKGGSERPGTGQRPLIRDLTPGLWSMGPVLVVHPGCSLQAQELIAWERATSDTASELARILK